MGEGRFIGEDKNIVHAKRKNTIFVLIKSENIWKQFE